MLRVCPQKLAFALPARRFHRLRFGGVIDRLTLAALPQLKNCRVPLFRRGNSQRGTDADILEALGFSNTQVW
jgi:hypothetical protein